MLGEKHRHPPFRPLIVTQSVRNSSTAFYFQVEISRINVKHFILLLFKFLVSSNFCIHGKNANKP